MPWFRIPGIPFRPSDRATRFTTHAAFRSFPHQRVVFRPTSPVRPRSFRFVSFCPVWSRGPGVHSFLSMKKGSFIPVRSVSPSWPCPPALHIPRTRPHAPAPVARSRLPRVAPARPRALAPTKGTSLAPLEERRAARQARDRPWLQGSVLAAARSRGPPSPDTRSSSGCSTVIRHSFVSNSSVSPSVSPSSVARSPPPPRPRNPSPPSPTSVSRFSSSSRSRVVSRSTVSRSSHAPTHESTRSYFSCRAFPSPSPATSGLIVKAAETHARQASAGSNSSRKTEKRVRFGETTVVSVPRWITRPEHTFVGVPAAMGHLQGWDVTALPEPDEAGETHKYTTYWGCDSHVMLVSNHAKGPCDRTGCAWNSLAKIQYRTGWGPRTVFKAWNYLREKRRERGELVL